MEECSALSNAQAGEGSSQIIRQSFMATMRR